MKSFVVVCALVGLLAGCGGPEDLPSPTPEQPTAEPASVVEAPGWAGAIDAHMGPDVPIPSGSSMLFLRRPVGKGFGY